MPLRGLEPLPPSHVNPLIPDHLRKFHCAHFVLLTRLLSSLPQKDGNGLIAVVTNCSRGAAKVYLSADLIFFNLLTVTSSANCALDEAVQQMASSSPSNSPPTASTSTLLPAISLPLSDLSSNSEHDGEDGPPKRKRRNKGKEKGNN